MASLADELAAASGRPGPRCTLSRWFPTLDDDARDEVLEAFRDGRVSDGVLAGWLAGQEGAPAVAPNQIGHHRRGRCVTCTTDGIDLRRRA